MAGIHWYLLRDKPDGVIGMALVHKSFRAELHRHEEPELYMFLRGMGLLQIEDRVQVVKSPSTVLIASNLAHAMKACTSEYVVLMFVFERGPFKTINYSYLSRYI